MTVPVKCAALFFGPLFGTLPTADMLVLGSKVPALSIAFGSVERRATALAISLASATAAA